MQCSVLLYLLQRPERHLSWDTPISKLHIKHLVHLNMKSGHVLTSIRIPREVLWHRQISDRICLRVRSCTASYGHLTVTSYVTVIWEGRDVWWSVGCTRPARALLYRHFTCLRQCLWTWSRNRQLRVTGVGKVSPFQFYTSVPTRETTRNQNSIHGEIKILFLVNSFFFVFSHLLSRTLRYIHTYWSIRRVVSFKLRLL